jgi:hypothetical protein
MKRNHPLIIGLALAAAVLGLTAWAVWLSSQTPPATTQVETVVVTESKTPDPKFVPPEMVIKDPSLAHLVPASQPWSGVSLDSFDFASEPPPNDYEIVCPSIECLTIFFDKLDSNEKGFMSARSVEHSGLVKFDLSKLPEPPIQAMLKMSVTGIENVRGYHTPVRLILRRMKTDWDDSATYKWTHARDQITWHGGKFNIFSDTDSDLTPIATVLVANPPQPGFNVQVDITPIVTGWFKKEFPNYGLLVSNRNGHGYSNQGWIPGRRRSSTHYPQIVCTFAKPVKAAAQPPVAVVEPARPAPRTRSFLDLVGALLPPATPATQPADAGDTGPATAERP